MSDSREYPPRPICAVGAVVRQGDSVLVVRRGKRPRLNEWTIPGGAVEVGETLRDAVRRELREECQIEISVGAVLDAVDIIERDELGRVRYDYAVVDFAAQYESGELAAGSDAADTRWVARQELDQLEMNATTRRVILEAFESTDDPP